MLSSPLVVKVRSMTRKIGLNKLIGSLLIGSRYADKFGPAFKACIRTRDTVWDVGANVGLYTAVFLQATGQGGHVVAFEPTAACFDQLRGRFTDPARVTLKNMALGDSDGTISIAVDADPLAATHHIVSGNTSGAGFVAVDVRAAGSLVKEAPDLFPNAVKIDVEGHEGAVLDGFEPLLADKRLHSIGIEVHFGLLDARGESARPRQMEQTLARNGFTVHWTDPSHLLATR